jgi:hypothetical protein
MKEPIAERPHALALCFSGPDPPRRPDCGVAGRTSRAATGGLVRLALAVAFAYAEAESQAPSFDRLRDYF